MNTRRSLAVVLSFPLFCQGLHAEPEHPPAGLVCAGAGAELVAPIDQAAAVRLSRNAAETARSRMGDTPVKAVIVYSFAPYPAAGIMEGVGAVFPPEKIYGGQSLGVITPDGGKHSAGVLAIGGDVEVLSAKAELNAGPENAAKSLIAAFGEPAAKAREAGKHSVCFLFGELGDGWAPLLFGPLAKQLGDDVPILGTGGSGEVYFQGKSAGRSVSALLVSGHFEIGHAMAGGDGVERIVADSESAMNDAVKDCGTTPRLAFIANCVSRRNKETIPNEVKALQKAACGAPVFGSYGKGEIGPGHKGGATASSTRKILISVIGDPVRK